MAIRVSDVFPRDALRYEPIEKWVRGEIGGETAVDSKSVWLVWLPGNVVPGWCFPRDDVRMDLLPQDAAHEIDDTDLTGRVRVDFRALDRWLEEEDEVVGHPRDPFKRVDARRSSRHVRVEVEGELLADSRRPLLVFETGLPVRYYLPREDVRMDLLRPSDTRSLCAYKGEASYLSAEGAEDVAWFYPDPLPDNAAIRDAVAFFNENADITVDGESAGRPSTQWSA
jgi:uncharacterized protein (DUF427 family)